MRRLAHEEMRRAEEERRSAREEALQQAEAELAEIRTLSRRLDREQCCGAAARDQADARRQSIEQAQQSVREFEREHLAPVRWSSPGEIKPGDRVRVVAFDEEGEVLAIEGGSADIQLGAIKVRQPWTDFAGWAPAPGRSDV